MEKQVRINTGSSLKALLIRVIDESTKSALHQKALTEKEKQEATASNLGADENSSEGGGKGLFGDSDEGDEGEESSTSKTMDDEMEKLKHGDIEPRDIVDKLNSIRSGKSFKDDKVSKSMDEYISSLSKAEKVALLAFLKGISQIVTGEVPAQKAEEPHDQPADVKMQKGDKHDVKHIRPNVIKKPEAGNKHGHPQEDTTSPAPITPKKR